MASDVTQREALIHLGASTAEAVARVLEMFVPGGVERGDVSVVAEGQDPFANLPAGGIAASVSLHRRRHRRQRVPDACRLCARPRGRDGRRRRGGGWRPLTELEMSAIGEASNQMLASAAAAISVVIGQEIEISPPGRATDRRPTSTPAEVWGTAPHACSTSFTIAGEPCRLVQLVPSAFVVRMARAIDEIGMRADGGRLRQPGRRRRRRRQRRGPDHREARRDQSARLGGARAHTAPDRRRPRAAGRSGGRPRPHR